METTVLKKGQVYVGVREEETGYEDHSDAKCWLFCGGVSSHMSEGPYSLVAQQCNETWHRSLISRPVVTGFM